MANALFSSSATPGSVTLLSRPSVPIPTIASGARRLIAVRAGIVLKVTAPTLGTGISIKLRLKFAQWTLDVTATTLAFEDAIEAVETTLASGTSVYVRPLPGFVTLEAYLDPSGTDASSVVLTVEEEVPSAFAAATDWNEVDVSTLEARWKDAENQERSLRVSGAMDPEFFAEFRVERASNGVYRAVVPWITDELQSVVDGSLGWCVRFRGELYRLCYVIPSDPQSIDEFTPTTFNDGNDRNIPRRSCPDLSTLPNRTCLILEAGHLFTAADGLKGNALAKDLIMLSTEPGQPAYLSNFVVRDTNLSSGFWTGTGPFTSTDSVLDGTDKPGMVVYDPLISYQDPDTGTTDPAVFTTPRPGMVPWTDQTVTYAAYSLSDSGSPGTRYTQDSTESPPQIAFIQSSTIESNLRLSEEVSVRLWMLDIEILGTARPLNVVFNGNGRHRVFAKDCAFRFATSYLTLDQGAYKLTSTPCVRGYGGVYMWLSRCEVTESLGDGVDFRGGKFSSPERLLSPHILEDRCRMLHCGCHPEDPNRKINQASTMHDGSRAVRVGSEYAITGGPCIQDVYLGNTKRSSYAVLAGC